MCKVNKHNTIIIPSMIFAAAILSNTNIKTAIRFSVCYCLMNYVYINKSKEKTD